MKLRTLNDLMHDLVRDTYDAEKQLVKALPKVAKAVSTPELKEAILSHLEETKGHVKRLEEVFKLLDHAARGKSCKAMEGLCEEGTEMIEMEADDLVRDAALIAAAQKVEHYEISAYGTMCNWAEILGLGDVKQILAETLAEEKAADDKLSMIAESQVNVMAPAQ